MSSQVVRTSFRAAFAAGVPTVPFFETIGQEPDTTALPALWATMDFIPFGEERLSIGSPSYWNEVGIVRVFLAAAAGDGDAAVLTASELVRSYFRNWQDTTNKIRLTSVMPPAEVQEESDGRWYTVTVDMFYLREFFA